jgi:hypothetical protein
MAVVATPTGFGHFFNQLFAVNLAKASKMFKEI